MSIYSFVDTTQLPPVKERPAEAVCFNGIWLDDEIKGFRTLNVQGRELSDKDIDTRDIKNKYGETFEKAVYRPRTITVTYQIIAPSTVLFRQYCNELNKCLTAEQVQLIFADEPDKYFIATKASNDEVDAGLNSVVGAIEFYCADPRKYALTRKSFAAELNDEGILEATIVNSGSVEVPISYEITHNHDNGYIGIVTDQGALQLGQPQEIDGETRKFSEKLLTIDDFIEAQDDHGTCYLQTDADTSGTCATISQHDSTWLGMGNPGSGNNWNGGQKTVSIPADSEDEIGALKWELYMFRWFQESNPNQFGEMCVNVMGDEHTQIAGMKVYDKTYGAYAGGVEFWANGKMYARKNFRPGERTTGAEGQYNVFHWTNGYDGMSKDGENIAFHFNGKYFIYRIPELKDVKATRIQVSFFRYGAHEAVTRNVLKSLDFTKHHIEKWVDMPNRFAIGDIVKIDGDTTKIYVNGLPRQEDEVRGSTYPKAVPGDTKVQFFYSDFCDPPPTIKAEIREAYL